MIRPLKISTKHRVRLLSLAGLLAVAGAALWVRPDWIRTWYGPRAPKNLLLVSIDTLRADHLGSFGYAEARTPRLDALAQSGLRFARAATVMPLTLPAHSSLMTGTFPAWHGVRDNGGFYLGEDHETLAETLRARGFRTGGFVSSFVLDHRWGIAQGFEKYFDDFDLESFGEVHGMDAIQRPGSETVDQALSWLSLDPKKPFFAWVHLYDPHTPYEAPEPYRSLFPATNIGAYDAEIAATDAQVGRLLDALRADGRLDDTLVIVTGDHGEMLGEHGELTHGFFLYNAVTQIPVIVSGPGIPSREIPNQIRIVDLMPTALELLRIASPKPVQGVSLMPLARGETMSLVAHSESWYPRYHYGWSELVSLQDDRTQYIRAPRPELYDLQLDPGQINDKSRDDPARVEAFDRALTRELARYASASAARGPQSVDAEAEERLAALGYIGSSVSARHLEDRPRGDPKDKIGLYNLMKQASGASAEGRFDEAIATIRKAIDADPEIVEAYMLLGNFQKKAKQAPLSIASYKKALTLDPEHQGALFSLASAYKDSGRLDEARVGFDRARALDPRNGKVLWQLADLLMQQGKQDEAQAVIRDALARKVDEHRFWLKLGESQIEAKQFGEAEKSLRLALEKKPRLEIAHFNLGLVHEERGEVEKAIAAYETELAGNPKAHRAAFNLAKLLQRQGRLQAAVTRFRQSVDLQPDFGTGQLYLAKALLDAGDLAGAEQWARKGLVSKPDPKIAPLGHFVLADVFNRQGRTADSQREVAAARRLQAAGR